MNKKEQLKKALKQAISVGQEQQANLTIQGANNTQIGDGKTTQLIKGNNNIQIADGSTSTLGNITINLNR